MFEQKKLFLDEDVLNVLRGEKKFFLPKHGDLE